jgi:hypothetical protein
MQTGADQTGLKPISQTQAASDIFIQKFEELVNLRNDIDRKIPYPYQVSKEITDKLTEEYQKKLPPGAPNIIQEEKKLIEEYKKKLQSGKTPSQIQEELEKKLLKEYQQKLIPDKTTPNQTQDEFSKKIIEEYQKKLNGTNSNQIQKELNKKLNETELNQVQKELLTRLKQSITVYANKKRAYIQDLNKRAVTLQQDISKLPKKHQAIAKQALTEFITLTKTEDKLFDHFSNLIPDFQPNKQTSQANRCTNYFKQIFGISQVYAQSENCSCDVSTEYLNPRLIKITTRCVCLVYIQYKQTFTQVNKLQKKFRYSWNKFKTTLPAVKPPKTVDEAKKRLANGTLIHQSPRIVIKNGKPYVTTSLRVRDVLIKNGGVAGSNHPKSNIKYDQNGFPIFKSYYTTKLPQNRWLQDPSTQFSYLNKQLARHIKSNPKLQSMFRQRFGNNYTNILKQFEEGKTPNVFTWNHHQEPGVMQLVDRKIHSKTGHLGGYSIWGKGQFK